MRRRSVQALLTIAAMAAAIVVGAAPASADPITPSSWTASPGGLADGVAGVTVLTDVTTGTQLTCESSTATGAVVETSATGSPARLVTLPAGSVGFQNCSGPFGLTFEVTHVGDWHLNGETFDPDTGVTAGTLTDIEANLSGFACSATVTGSVQGSYDNNTGVLSALPTPTLTISFVDPVDDCFGLIATGDNATFDGGYTITPHQTITGVA
jgi:hypothetical protein